MLSGAVVFLIVMKMKHRIVSAVISIGANYDFSNYDHQGRHWRFNRPCTYRRCNDDGFFALLLGDVGANRGAHHHFHQFCTAGVSTKFGKGEAA